MFHALAPDRPDHAFSKAILPRRGRRGRLIPDALLSRYLFDAVQAKLAEQLNNHTQKHAKSDATCRYDEAGMRREILRREPT